MLCFPRSDGAQLGVPQWGESLRQTGESKSPSGWGIPDPESSKRLGRRQALCVWGGDYLLGSLSGSALPYFKIPIVTVSELNG